MKARRMVIDPLKASTLLGKGRTGEVFLGVSKSLYWFLSKIYMPTVFFAIPLLLFMQVVFRYCLNSPLSWTEEVACIIMTWMTYAGMGMTAFEKKEIAFTGLLGLLPNVVTKWLQVLVDVIVVLFLIVLFYNSILLIRIDWAMTTAATEISWGWIYMALSVGVVFYGFLVFPQILGRFYKNKFVTIICMVLILFFYILVKMQLFEKIGFSLVVLTPIVMVFFIIVEMPIGFALGATCLYYLVTKGNIPLMLMPRSFTYGLNSFTILALPLFIFAGDLMNEGGVTDRIIKFVLRLFGHIRGSLGYVSVVVNMIMAGMSGSAMADTAATGTVLIPEMYKKKYSKGFACAVIAASGAIGPIIPPSIFFIIYAGLANVSILRLFLGGFIPGLIMGVFLMITVFFVTKKRNYPVESRSTLSDVFESFRKSVLGLSMPIVVIGGMIAGVFTATEAGAIAVFYSLGMGFWYKGLTIPKILQSLYRTALISSALLIIFSMVNLISQIINRTNVPEKVLEILLSFSSTTWIALLVVIVFLLALGCFEAVTPILIVMTPILAPAMSKMGVDPVHFGVIFVLTLTIALMTPPYGSSMFLVIRLGDIGVGEYLSEVWPFLLALLIFLFIIAFVPGLTLFLPNLLG